MSDGQFCDHGSNAYAPACGHPEGDRALVEAAEALRETFRESDIVAGLGGDKFVVLLVGGLEDRGEAGMKRLLAEELEVIVEDVTERRAMEKQLRTVQKFDAIGQLAGGIAHDFNNVIGAILGWAELGLDQAPAESPLRSYFQKIRVQADRAASLTRQLLAFARRQILEPRDINLNHTIADLLSLLEKVIGGNIEVKAVTAPDLEAVRADPTQVEQVLMNLCLNARDAMPHGGQLVIETQNVEVGEEHTRLYSYVRPGRHVRLEVSDNGVGHGRGHARAHL